METKELSPADIANWYRTMIRKYQKLLTAHESEFPVAAPVLVKARAVQPEHLPQLASVDAAAIKAYLRNHKGRAADIAKALNVSKDDIKAIIADPINGLSDSDRGWVKVID